MSGTERGEDVRAELRERVAKALWASDPPFIGYAWDEADDNDEDKAHYLGQADAVLDALAAALAEHEGCVPRDEYDRHREVYWRLEAEAAALRTEREALREALALAERALRDQPMQAFRTEDARRRRAAAIAAARAFLARTDTPEPQP